MIQEGKSFGPLVLIQGKRISVAVLRIFFVKILK